MVDKKDVDLYIKMEQRHAKDVENAYKLGKLDILEKLKAEIEEKQHKLDCVKMSDVALKTAYIEVAKIIDNHIAETKGE